MDVFVKKCDVKNDQFPRFGLSDYIDIFVYVHFI